MNNKKNISQIAKEFRAYPGNMTRTLDKFISLGLLKKEEKEGKKTGWYALTPPKKMTWLNTGDGEEEPVISN